MKRFIAVFLILVLSAALFGCEKNTYNSNDGKIDIVCTSFPQYDWVREIIGDAGDKFNLSYLTDNGVDMHSYQPTVGDIVAISSCDVLIYNGGESEKWIDDITENGIGKNTVVINLMNELGDRKKHETEPEGSGNDGHKHHDNEEEYDEHIWLSLENAVYLCNVIKDKLSAVSLSDAKSFGANTENYTSKLSKLKEEYISAVDNSKIKTIVVADRFAFRYLADECNLKYYAAFPGCSAETEASFETVVFLAIKVSELDIPVILTMENSDDKLAKTIIKNSKDCKIMVLNSMQSTDKNTAENETYLKIMQSNLKVLKAALGE